MSENVPMTREEMQVEALKRGYGYHMVKIAIDGCDSIFLDFDSDLRKMKMNMHITPVYNSKHSESENDDEGLACQITIAGTRVLSMTDDYVWVYIPGDWEDMLMKKYKADLRKK